MSSGVRPWGKPKSPFGFTPSFCAKRLQYSWIQVRSPTVAAKFALLRIAILGEVKWEKQLQLREDSAVFISTRNFEMKTASKNASRLYSSR